MLFIIIDFFIKYSFIIHQRATTKKHQTVENQCCISKTDFFCLYFSLKILSKWELSNMGIKYPDLTKMTIFFAN